MQFTSILSAYNLNTNCKTEPFGSGLINNTWKISCDNEQYILQRINTTVFKKPYNIAENLKALSTYLKGSYPDYLFVKPLSTITGEELYVSAEGEFYRMFPFIINSHTYDVVQNTGQAFEAATQFARFTKLLAEFDVSKLKVTIPHFHDLSLRYQQFLEALSNGNAIRIKQAAKSIEWLKNNYLIVEYYEKIKRNPNFKIRVTHHDTKISNVLFNNNDKGICVIDLDTVMPGYYISDVGDMLRTYLSPVSEEEKEFGKIEIREDYFEAIVVGYLNEMKSELTKDEIKSFIYAGKFLIYMQALRFLTDYLNNDVYYGSKYEGHNLIRANNQITLLEKLAGKEEVLNKIVSGFL